MKKFLKPLLYSLGFLVLSTFLATFLNYIGALSSSILKIILIVIPIVAFFLNGLLIGKDISEKGWLNGLKSGSILLILLILLALIFNVKFRIIMVFYYLFLLVVSSGGSIISINKIKK